MSENTESIEILKRIKASGEKVLKEVEALGKEIEVLKKKQVEMKVRADAISQKHGPESPEYSQFSTELKAMRPEIEKRRLFYDKAVDKFLSGTIGGPAFFEKYIWPALNEHFIDYKKKVARSIRDLVDGEFAAERMASETRPVQVFLQCIQGVRWNFAGPHYDLNICRNNLRLIAELTKEKPDFEKFWEIKTAKIK